MASSRSAARTESLNIRIRPEVRGLIDRAAAISGRTRTDFVLDAARKAAEEALLERTFLEVGPQPFRQFLSRLDAAPKPNARLRKAMQTAAPWD